MENVALVKRIIDHLPGIGFIDHAKVSSIGYVQRLQTLRHQAHSRIRKIFTLEEAISKGRELAYIPISDKQEFAKVGRMARTIISWHFK